VFPAVLSDPPARPDATLTPAEVKQATDNLISEREHLCSETEAGQSRTTTGTAANCGTADLVTTGTTQTAGTNGRP
jgi:hypothetical protein